jgi:hypothetical protein
MAFIEREYLTNLDVNVEILQISGSDHTMTSSNLFRGRLSSQADQAQGSRAHRKDGLLSAKCPSTSTYSTIFHLFLFPDRC